MHYWENAENVTGHGDTFRVQGEVADVARDLTAK